MFFRLIADNFTRRPRRKLLTAAALALGMAIATAALSVSLDVGDRLSEEFKSLGANLVVTPQADSLPLEIGGVDYRPANSGAYLPESDLPKIKSIFWHNNIIAFAPILESERYYGFFEPRRLVSETQPRKLRFIGTWIKHKIALSDGSSFTTGIVTTNPWWKVEGRWFSEESQECVVGERIAERLNIRIGDRLAVDGGDEKASPVAKVVGIVSTGDSEDDAVFMSLDFIQRLNSKPGLYRKLYVLALTKPEDAFAHRDPKTMAQKDFERWSCTPYVSSIAYSIQEVLPGSDVRVIHRIADSEGQILTRVRSLLWLVTLAALLAAALAVGASSAASVIERRSELALMKALGAGSGMVGFLLAAAQLF